jgi:hypothetical protein
VKRFSVRNMVEAGAMNDLKAACVYDGETVTVTVVFFVAGVRVLTVVSLPFSVCRSQVVLQGLLLHFMRCPQARRPRAQP